MDSERIQAIRERRDKAFPDSLDLTAMWRTVPDLLDALEASQAALARAEQALADIQFDLINCHQAAGRGACEHLTDAIRIVNAALAAATSTAAGESEGGRCQCAHLEKHHYPDSCCFANDLIGEYQERCPCQRFKPRELRASQPEQALAAQQRSYERLERNSALNADAAIAYRQERDEALAESRSREAALREALAWYADEDRYSIEKPRVLESNDPQRIPPVVWDATDAVFDSGQRARAALAAEQPAAQRAAEGEGVWRR